MLPRSVRLTRRRDFTLAVRAGRRAGRATMVVHLLLPTAAEESAHTGPAQVGPGEVRPARVGFVVGRGVGGSVDRHRVIRRLRHLARERLDRLPAGALMVVRAQPAARDAEFGALARDLDAALDRLLGSPTAAGAGTAGDGRLRAGAES